MRDSNFFAWKLVKREHGSRVLGINDAGSQFLKQQLGIELEEWSEGAEIMA